MLMMTTLHGNGRDGVSLPMLSYHHHPDPRLTGRSPLSACSPCNLCQWPLYLSVSRFFKGRKGGRGALPSYDSISKTRQNAIIWGRPPHHGQRPQQRLRQSDLGLCPLRERRASAGSRKSTSTHRPLSFKDLLNPILP